MAEIGATKLELALRKISDALGNNPRVAVGFLSNATYPDGTPVAQIAAIQNFGAPAAGVPARAFFSDMIVKNSPGWGVQLGKILKAANYDGELALKRMGLNMENQLRQSIDETNSPPLAAATIARKGFDKPLVDTGHMKNSISSELME